MYTKYECFTTNTSEDAYLCTFALPQIGPWSRSRSWHQRLILVTRNMYAKSIFPNTNTWEDMTGLNFKTRGPCGPYILHSSITTFMDMCQNWRYNGTKNKGKHSILVHPHICKWFPLVCDLKINRVHPLIMSNLYQDWSKYIQWFAHYHVHKVIFIFTHCDLDLWHWKPIGFILSLAKLVLCMI